MAAAQALPTKGAHASPYLSLAFFLVLRTFRWEVSSVLESKLKKSCSYCDQLLCSSTSLDVVAVVYAVYILDALVNVAVVADVVLVVVGVIVVAAAAAAEVVTAAVLPAIIVFAVALIAGRNGSSGSNPYRMCHSPCRWIQESQCM